MKKYINSDKGKDVAPDSKASRKGWGSQEVGKFSEKGNTKGLKPRPIKQIKK